MGETVGDGPGPEIVEAAREKMAAALGHCVLAMMADRRYRGLALSDLAHAVMEPLARNRVAIATARRPAGSGPGGAEALLTAVAIWASVDEATEAEIAAQIEAGAHPVRLKPAGWTSGDRIWLLDIVAPTREMAAAVVANFRRVAGTGEIRVHPAVGRAVGAEALARAGIAPGGDGSGPLSSRGPGD